MTVRDDEQDQKLQEIEKKIQSNGNGTNGNINKLLLGAQGKLIGILLSSLLLLGGFIFTKVVMGNINDQKVMIDEVNRCSTELKSTVKVHEEQIITLKKGFEDIKTDVKDTKKSTDDMKQTINDLKILIIQNMRNK